LNLYLSLNTKIMLTSIGTFLPKVSSDLGLEILAIETGVSNSPYELRFAELDKDRSFALKVSRSWKTTQVTLIFDSFAGEISTYLCSRLIDQRSQIEKLIEQNLGKYSSFLLEIDGKPFFISALDAAMQHELKFEVETLTSESSIQFGLLSTQEETLLKFALTFFAELLPRVETSYRGPEEVIGFPEGASSQVLVNRYERDPRNRKAAIALHGKICMACGFNFQEVYGELGDDYIVVHHLTPVSAMGENYIVDPQNDLVTICANCHAMVHRKNPPLTISELKRFLE
jgi:5-methylcytosine-specific restriction enzyme A